MRILFFGDIMGRSGRDAVIRHLPALKEKLKPEVIIANGENAANGRGITDKICHQLYEAGIDCITTGNHVWDQKEIITYIDSDPKLLRPYNWMDGAPGRGVYLHQLQDGRKIVIVNLMARLFMDQHNDPFAAALALVSKHRLGLDVNAFFVDFHGETTSEKMCLAHYLDGKVSAVVGTHTHIPTADAHVLPGGTGVLTDAGMCGDYNSVIGMEIQVSIHRFTRKVPGIPYVPADGEGTVCGAYIVTNDKTGRAERIEPVRVGNGILQETIPQP